MAYSVVIKRTENSDKFRQAAITYQKNGYYTPIPKGTTEYRKHWDEEYRRCLFGYTAEDGDYISGYFYFYLNYSPILQSKKDTVKMKSNEYREVLKRVRDFPKFYDYDRAYFEAVDEAERLGKHLVVIKKRQAGYSFKGSSMLCRNFYLIPDSKSYAIASENEFLLKDGLLTKAWDLMDFIDEHTPWSKKRQKIDQRMHKRASIVINKDGVQTEIGYKSEIIGVSLKNDPQKARGKKAKLILWEEGGKFPNLKTAWQIARPSVEDSGMAVGLMIAYGTGGSDDADYTGLKDLFYEPNAYNALAIENTWDEENYGTEGGFFVPEYYNMYGLYRGEDTSLHGQPFMDKDGNSNIFLAKKYSTEERKKVSDNASDRSSIDRYICEHPFTPAEATLNIKGNIFPKADLIRHLANIRNSKKLSGFKQVGDLVYVEGRLKWEISSKLTDLNKYRLEPGQDKTGAIVIWEHPVDDPPYGLYIAGCLLPGEKVLTNEGLLNVEDVNYTNRLVDKDGDLVNIKALLRYDKENEDTYTLKMSNTYRTTTFTKEHPIYVSDHSLNKQNLIKENLFKFDFKKVSDVKVGDWVKYPNIYLCNESDEHYGPISEYWWLIGLWLGDGWCSKNRIYVCFDKTNISQIERLKKFVEMFYTTNISIRERNGSIECSFVADKLRKDLLKFGRYASGKFIPGHIKYEENLIKQNLLLGFLDSDGCVYKDKRGYISLEFVSMNLRLLEDFQDIAFSLGIVSNLSKLRDEGDYNIEGRIGKQHAAYHLRFGHTDSIKFANLCNFDIRSKLSKIDKNNIKQIRTRPKSGCFLSEDNKYIYFQIKDITKGSYTGIVYNFETETHSFCTRHISTHNCDPYDHDHSTTNSLGSCIIYKRFQNFESYYDLPVAEYTGRPDTAEQFYEKVRNLVKYYNALLLYENEKKGLYVYFTQKHEEYLLADQPDVINDVLNSNTKVNRKKGIHMNKEIKLWGERIIRDYLNEEYAPGYKNLTKIFSEPLLEELISYNEDGNFDRVMAFMMVMIYKEELHSVHVKRKKEYDKSRWLFPEPLFKHLDTTIGWL